MLFEYDFTSYICSERSGSLAPEKINKGDQQRLQQQVPPGSIEEFLQDAINDSLHCLQTFLTNPPRYILGFPSSKAASFSWAHFPAGSEWSAGFGTMKFQEGLGVPKLKLPLIGDRNWSCGVNFSKPRFEEIATQCCALVLFCTILY